MAREKISMYASYAPKGSKGQKRPADVIGNAVKVMRIATGEEVDIVAVDGIQTETLPKT